MLPLDILRLIFDELCAISIDRPHEITHQYLEMARIPIHLTSVCSYWRQVAIRHPPLWSAINLTDFSEERLLMYAERSQAHPLIVLWSLGLTYRKPWTTRFYFANTYRIRYLQVHFLREDEFLFDLYDISAPCLEGLDLYLLGPISDNQFFTHEMPRLRILILSLECAKMPTKSCLYHHLTTLCLRNPSGEVSADRCIALLGELPNSTSLECLELSLRSTGWPEDVPILDLVSDSVAKIALVSLRIFRLLVPGLQSAATILGSITLPNTLDELIIDLGVERVARLRDLLHPRFLPPGLLCSLLATTLVVYPPYPAMISNSFNYSQDWSNHSSRQFNLSWCPPASEDGGYLDDMISVFAEMNLYYPTPHLKVLVLDGSFISRESYEPGRCPQLRMLSTIVAQTTNIEELRLLQPGSVDTFSRLLDEVKTLSQDLQVWPNLTRLFVVDVELTMPRLQIMVSLCEALSAPGSLHTLILVRCSLVDIDLDVLDCEVRDVMLRLSKLVTVQYHKLSLYRDGLLYNKEDRMGFLNDILAKNDSSQWIKCETIPTSACIGSTT